MIDTDAAPGSTEYCEFDAEDLLKYIGARTALTRHLGGHSGDWHAEELYGGNLNRVFVIRGPDGALCAKQSLPYFRLLGTGTQMPLNRIHFERHTLATHAKFAAARIPLVYHFDPALRLLVMQYLDGYQTLRNALMNGQSCEHVGPQLGEYLALVIFNTSDLTLDPAQRRRHVATMADNSGMYRFIEDLMFTEPYMLHPRNAWNAPYLDSIACEFRTDLALKVAVSRLKRRYMTAGEVLLHGDLHTDSVLVNAYDTRVIDLELSLYGPLGWDLAMLFAHLLLNYYSCDGRADNPAQLERCRTGALTLLETIWQCFECTIIRLWQAGRAGQAVPDAWFGDDNGGTELETAVLQALLADVLHDAAGFAGTEITRRILNLGQVPDLQSIANQEQRARCEMGALRLARDLIVNTAQYTSAQKIAAAARAQRNNAR